MTQLSVIIAAINAPDYLAACLQALARQEGGIDVEWIVAAAETAVSPALCRQYPQLRLVELPPPVTIPALRAAAFAIAQGDIVALTEDHCLPLPNWCREIVAAHARQPQQPAIGGTVENGATARAVDWAAFYCEYYPFVRPLPAAPAPALPGPNLSYKRPFLGSLIAQNKMGYDGAKLHRYWQAQGITLQIDPALRVIHKKHFTLYSFARERFYISRWVARERPAFHALLTPLLPPLLLWRMARHLWPRRAHRAPFLRALPPLLLFLVVWAFGEAVAALFGAGDSRYHLR